MLPARFRAAVTYDYHLADMVIVLGNAIYTVLEDHRAPADSRASEFDVWFLQGAIEIVGMLPAALPSPTPPPTPAATTVPSVSTTPATAMRADESVGAPHLHPTDQRPLAPVFVGVLPVALGILLLAAIRQARR